MSNIDLWKIYYMTTNAKLDVWTINDLQKANINPKLTQTLIGKPKLRLTFAIEKLKTLNSGENLYLVCQINTTYHPKALDIPSSLKQINSLIHGYVLPINIRIASESEFKKYKSTIFIDQDERIDFYNKVWDKLHNDFWLSYRFTTIQKLKNGKYDNYNQKSVIKLLKDSQFNIDELKIKR